MNQIDFTQTGGFPLDQDVFSFQQLNTFMVQQIAAVCGPRAILAGCVVTGGTVGSGYVVIDGEVLPFVGGVAQTKVRIVETRTDMNYENGDTHPSQIERYAQFGDDGVTTILWADFVRNTTAGVLKRADNLETNSAALQTEIDGINGDIATLGADITDLENTKETVWARGSTYIGDADTNHSDTGGGTTRTISIGKTLANTNYAVFLTVVSLSANAQNDLLHQPTIRVKRTTSFDVYFREMANTIQNIQLDWIIFKL